MHAYSEFQYNIPKQPLVGGEGMANSTDLLNALEALLYGSTIYNDKLKHFLSLSHSLSGVYLFSDSAGSLDQFTMLLFQFSHGGFPHRCFNILSTVKRS